MGLATLQAISESIRREKERHKKKLKELADKKNKTKKRGFMSR